MRTIPEDEGRNLLRDLSRTPMWLCNYVRCLTGGCNGLTDGNKVLRAHLMQRAIGGSHHETEVVGIERRSVVRSIRTTALITQFNTLKVSHAITNLSRIW